MHQDTTSRSLYKAALRITGVLRRWLERVGAAVEALPADSQRSSVVGSVRWLAYDGPG